MKTKIYTDGGCSRNGSLDATGVAVVYHDKVVSELPIKEWTEGECKVTNNIAEYMGIALALKYINNENIKEVTISSDSKLVVNSLNYNWNVKSPNIKKLYQSIRKTLRLMKAKGFNIDLIWEGRDNNKAGIYIEEKYSL